MISRCAQQLPQLLQYSKILYVTLFSVGVLWPGTMVAQENSSARYPSFFSFRVGGGYMVNSGYAGLIAGDYVTESDHFSIAGVWSSHVPFHSDTTLITDVQIIYGRISRVHGRFISISAGPVLSSRKEYDKVAEYSLGLGFRGGHFWILDDNSRGSFRWLIGCELNCSLNTVNSRIGILISIFPPLPVGGG